MYNNGKTISILMSEVVPFGRYTGIRQNRLANFLNYPDDGSTKKPSDEIKSLLPDLLAPLSYANIWFKFEDDSILLSSQLSGKNSRLLIGGTKEKMNVMSLSENELIDMVFENLATGAITNERKVELSMGHDALLTLFCLADCLHRRQMDQRFLPVFSNASLPLSELEKQASSSVEEKDFRWLTPFILSIDVDGKAFNVNEGAMELSTLGLLSLRGKTIELNADQLELLKTLASAKQMVGIRNLSYQKDHFQLSQSVLIRAENEIYFSYFGSFAALVSISYEKMREVIKTWFLPGDDPGFDSENDLDFNSGGAFVSALVCSNCGCESPMGTKFCPNCGDSYADEMEALTRAKREKEEVPPSAVCPACGQQVATGVKFCSHCGTSLEKKRIMPPAMELEPVKNKPSFCNKCGAETDSKMKFCLKCGAPLTGNQASSDKMANSPKPPAPEMTCVNCGAKIKSGVKFCTKCGQSVQ